MKEGEKKRRRREEFIKDEEKGAHAVCSMHALSTQMSVHKVHIMHTT